MPSLYATCGILKAITILMLKLQVLELFSLPDSNIIANACCMIFFLNCNPLFLNAEWIERLALVIFIAMKYNKWRDDDDYL